MWAAGCIFGEILRLTSFDKDHEFKGKTTILFPGKCWFPLSPKKENDNEKFGFPLNKDDQLHCILQLIGSPDPIDGFDFINGKKIKKYAKCLPKGANCLNSIFVSHIKDDSILDLMNNLLTFNPHKRISAQNSLSHPFFASFSEENLIWKTEEIWLDFENDLKEKLTKKKLRKYFEIEFKYSIQNMDNSP